MEPNVDRGMWSVVGLLAAIVIGGVVLLAFPKISGKIANSMDDTVNKAFDGETPNWVVDDGYYSDNLSLKEKHDTIVEDVYVPKSNYDIMRDLRFVKSVALTYNGTYHFNRPTDQRKDLNWILVESESNGANEVSQVIDVSQKSELNVTLLSTLNDKKPYEGFGKIYGLDKDKKFVEIIVDRIMPEHSFQETYDIKDYDYIVIHVPFSSHKGWKISFDDVNYVEHIINNYQSIIREEDLDFGLSENTYWLAYSGAKLSLEENQNVSEWNTTKATRIKTTGGTRTTKYYLNPERKGVFGDPNTIYFSSMYIKNNGESPIRYSLNTGTVKIINPGESKRVILSDNGRSNGHRQVSLGTQEVNQDMDITVYDLHFMELTDLNF